MSERIPHWFAMLAVLLPHNLHPELPATFSLPVLASLLLILLAGGWVFATLSRQWTTDRPRAVLSEWGNASRFRLRLPPLALLPAALSSLASHDPQVEAVLQRGPVLFIRFTTAGRSQASRLQWNLMMREVDSGFAPAALRPASARLAFCDLFTLNGFPALLPPERFVVFAVDTRDARALARSGIIGLLPGDISLMLHGRYVTIDFSSRAFDPIEFNRMQTIMQQIQPHLPSASNTGW